MAFITAYLEPSGTDGFFYLKQIRSLSLLQQFYFPDHSLAFGVPYLLNLFLHNELLAFQYSVVSVMAMIGLGLWWVVSPNRRSWQSFSFGILVLLVLTVFAAVASNYFLYDLCYSYFKTGTGLMFFLFGIGCLKSSETSRRRSYGGWVFLSVLFFVASLMSHKSMLALWLIYFFVRFQWRFRDLFLLLSMGIAGVAVLGDYYPAGRDYVLYLINEQFVLPFKYYPWLVYLWKTNNWLWFGPMLTIVGLLVALGVQTEADKRLALFTGVLGFIAWNPFLLQGMDAPTYRLAILHWVVSPVLLVGILVKDRSFIMRSLGVALACLVMGAFKQGPSLHGLFKGYTKLDSQILQLNHYVQSSDHLTCHHGLEFYVDYKTPIRCRSFLASDPNKKQWRIAWVPLQRNGPWHQIRVVLNVESPLRLGKDYFLIDESRWQQIVSTFQPKLNWRNPNQTRPAYIAE